MMVQTPAESQRLARELRAEILAGSYRPGERLPTEQDLCERFGVSRATTREGLRILQEQSLIHRRQGSGSYVNPRPQRHIPLVHGGYFHSVEPYLDELTRRVLEHDWMAADEPVASALHVAAGAAVLRAQRVDRLRGEPVAVDELWLIGGAAADVGESDLRRLDFLAHWQTLAGITVDHVRQTVAAVGAPASIARLLAMQRGRPALRETCVAHLADGRPGGLFITHYRPDVFYLQSIVRHVPHEEDRHDELDV